MISNVDFNRYHEISVCYIASELLFTNYEILKI